MKYLNTSRKKQNVILEHKCEGLFVCVSMYQADVMVTL